MNLPAQAQGYGLANLQTLLGMLRGDRGGLELSRPPLRGLYLQETRMRDATQVGSRDQGRQHRRGG